jgi:L-rhamnose mutarotase
MQRVAFQLRIRAGCEAAYDEEHRHVWPELLAELQALGVRRYSIFRYGQQLFLSLLISDFDLLQKKLDMSDINQRWQQKMAPLFEPVPGLKKGEKLAMMAEVFYMAGDTSPEKEGAEEEQHVK